MIAEKLVSRYIATAERVLKEIQITETPLAINDLKAREIIKSAEDYLRDARYYREKEKFEVSLTSVAYCEGLLDALRMLGVVRFNWSTTTEKKESERQY